MKRLVILCAMLAGCSGVPGHPFGNHGSAVHTALLPTAELALRPASDAEARGAALASEAAALKVRAAAIPTD